MKATWSLAWSFVLVLVTCGIGIVLTHVALGVGADSTPWPRFSVILVYFWMLHRPGIMAIPMVFAVGLAQDLILGDIPGAGLLALVMASMMMMRSTASLRTMPLVWRLIGFAGFAALVFALEWVLTAAARLTLPPLDLVMVQGGMTFLLYPVISVAMRQIFRIGRTPIRSL